MSTPSSKKKLGRPVSTDPASERLPTVRVTPAQRDSYVEAAGAQGLKVSAWVKRTLDQAVVRARKTRRP